MTGRLRIQAFSAVIAAAGIGTGVARDAQGQSYNPSEGGALTSSRPSSNSLNRLNRVGFSNIGSTQSNALSASLVSRRGMSRSADLIRGGFAQGTPVSANLGLSRLPSTKPAASGSWIQRIPGTRSVRTDFRRSRNLPWRVRSPVLDTLFSRHSVANQIDELPFSASAALAWRQDFVASSVSEGSNSDREAGNDMLAPAPGTDAKELSAGDLLNQRLSLRRHGLVFKGRAEFRAGNYQRAFGQFVMAASIGVETEPDPQRLVLLTSIAAGNYARGANVLSRLLEEGPGPFVSDGYGIDWLYPESIEIDGVEISGRELFERHMSQLRAFRARSSGDASPLVLYPYALWLMGEERAARQATRDVIDKAPQREVALVAQRMLDRLEQRPSPSKTDWSEVWSDLLR